MFLEPGYESLLAMAMAIAVFFLIMLGVWQFRGKSRESLSVEDLKEKFSSSDGIICVVLESDADKIGFIPLKAGTDIYLNNKLQIVRSSSRDLNPPISLPQDIKVILTSCA